VPTLEEIAKLAGVSRSTVSRVVNDNPRGKDYTRARVLDVIQKANFQPSTAARRLGGGRSGIIGLVIPVGVPKLFSDPCFPVLLQSVSSACNKQSMTVMLWLAEPDYEQRIINQIINTDILDGVIVSSMSVTEPIVEALSKSNLPFVLIGRHPTNNNINFVDSDNQNGAYNIVCHLIKSGKKKIGTITGTSNMIASQDRLEGYKQALIEHDLEIIPDLILDGDFSEEGGIECTKDLILKDVDAIFAASDFMALGALKALKEAGKQVPQEIALVGIDDAPLASTTDPPLTTVKQATDLLGSKAVELLSELINNKSTSPKQIIIPLELQMRKSG
jgi:LacI family transcriptional regulator